MRTEYGVPVPQGVRKDWDCSSTEVSSGGHVLRKYHVDPMWEDPRRCVAWFDRFDRMRVIVGHYPNGRSATVRVDANGRWSTTFSRVPASVDGRRMAETENTGSVPQGTTSAVPGEASADAPPSAPSLQTPQGGDS